MWCSNQLSYPGVVSIVSIDPRLGQCYNENTFMKPKLFDGIRGVVYSAREAHNLTG